MYIHTQYGYFQSIIVYYSVSKNKQNLVFVVQARCHTTKKEVTGTTTHIVSKKRSDKKEFRPDLLIN